MKEIKQQTHMRMPLITGINDYAWELHVVGNKFNEGSKVYEA